jgi:hypothetical protein
VGLAGAGSFARYDATIEPRIGADEAAARFEAWRRAVHGDA